MAAMTANPSLLRKLTVKVRRQKFKDQAQLELQQHVDQSLVKTITKATCGIQKNPVKK